jgi:DNA-binding SARP family transcriptional activator
MPGWDVMVVELTEALVEREVGDARPVLHLFGGPFVTIGRRRVSVPQGSKRLLVFVALHRGQVDRAHAAGTLWPTGSEFRAAGNLRSALWRLSRVELPLLTADNCHVALDHNLRVDAHLVGEWAARIIGGHPSEADLSFQPSGAVALDLLPGWYEDWALLERERLRQRMLHALEALSRLLIGAGRIPEGVEAAITAVAADPLRESAQRTLIEAHLAEGNWSEGRRQFEAYRRLLRRELGIEPDERLAALVHCPPQRPHADDLRSARSAPLAGQDPAHPRPLTRTDDARSSGPGMAAAGRREAPR